MSELQKWFAGQGLTGTSLVLFLLFLALSVQFLGLYCYYAIRGTRIDRVERSKACEVNVEAVGTRVGYKQVTLWDPRSYKPFLGVGGGRIYGADEEKADSRGFHSYYTCERALAHEQKGNAVLEVVNSGLVQLHSQGMEASHQRVLQLILGACQSCGGRQATLWVEDRNATGLGKRHLLLCGACCDTAHVQHSLEELQETLRSATGVPLLVATLEATSARGSFLPTEVVGSHG